MACSSEKIQKSPRVIAPADRISTLPESLIFHILAFLPTKDAVATSLLSRSWKSLWTKVATLNFALIEPEKHDPRRRQAFVHFVDKVLLGNDVECLDKFRLQWITTHKCQPIHVNWWLSHAIARDVRVLDLHVNSAKYNSQTELSGKVFICESLECLRLEGPILVKVPDVVSLPLLEQLDLINVKFCYAQCFPKLISSCPVLHSLKFQECCQLRQQALRVSSPSLRFLEIRLKSQVPLVKKMEIDAPSLESLKYEDRFGKLCVIERPNFVNRGELSISSCTHSVELCNSIVEMIQALNNIVSLKLYGSIVKALSLATIPLSTRFERLTELDVHRECGDWSSLNVMLGCSPNLRALKITKSKCTQCTHGGCWSDPKEVPMCLFYSLKEISFSNFQGFKHEVAMIRYVFKHGVVLRRIHLRTGADDPKEELQILNKVTVLPRRSFACEIHFN
ncbi:OLC1v1010417C1 [Oldenlandia corymbosa var. corymbosa]|uniref:OLC1v1010417C1 n=1 Tax=Oldenlandia corymbosa var. corymbosa TaxID=529605 RepID=A0AAV1DRC0_OLDCO|nr:OLC1v1010417C1 [Oldenlandia corymbosa var. corymbosa]